MTGHDEGNPRVFVSGDAGQRVEIINDVFKICDEGTFAVAISVPKMVFRVDGEPSSSEGLGNVRIAGAMLGVSVYVFPSFSRAKTTL